MSPSQDDGPKTPDRRQSSSTIIDAFRALTGRAKATPPAAPSTSAIITPGSSAFARRDSTAVLQTIARGSGIGDVGGESAQGITAPPGHVLGGPDELNQLLEQISGHGYVNVKDRVAAAQNLCKIVEEYAVSDILTIWSSASDLIDNAEHQDATRAGYDLLKSCAKVPTLSAMERNVFFKVISSKKNDPSFEQIFPILVELTNGGRNVDGFEPMIAPFLRDLLERTVRSTVLARKQERGKSKAGVEIKENVLLEQLFQFIIDVTRFNSKVFPEEEVEQLLENVINVCRTTNVESDIRYAVAIFDALGTYTQVPPTSLKSCLAVLCDIYRQLKAVEEHTWNALRNLFTSHVGQSAVSALLSILTENTYEGEYSRHRSIVRGVLYTLRKLLILDGAEGFPKVGLDLLLPSLNHVSSYKDLKIDGDIISLLLDILQTDKLRNLLVAEDDWTDLTRTLAEFAAQYGIHETTPKETARIGSLSGFSNKSTESSTDRRDANGNIDHAACLSEIINSLVTSLPDMDILKKAVLMNLFLRFGRQISHNAAYWLVEYCNQERRFYPSNEGYLRDARKLVECIFQDRKRPTELRLKLLEYLQDAYYAIEPFPHSADVSSYAVILIETIGDESDVAVLNTLTEFAIENVQWSSDNVFNATIAHFKRLIKTPKATLEQPTPREVNFSSTATIPWSEDPGSLCNVVVRALVRMFIRTINSDGRRAKILFECLLFVAGSETSEIDARVSAFKLLFRLRSDTNHALFIAESSEGQRMAAVLSRTQDTAVSWESKEEDDQGRQSRTDERSQSQDYKNSSSPTATMKQVTRVTSGPQRTTRPASPVWMYGGFRALPEEPQKTASTVLFSSKLDTEDLPTDRIVLEITRWLELNISILQKGTHWELYSYILAHLGAQLTNQSLFASAIPQVKLLKSVLCEQIRSTTFHEPPSYTSLKKGDVVVCLFHILTMIISYHPHFTRNELEDLVRSFLSGIGSWDRTTKWCIHALAVCCHELPLSTSRHMESILTKMSQSITQPNIAIHILEFLAGVSRLPEIIKNCREDNFRTVFGICFRYLDYVRNSREKGRVSHPNPSRTGHPTSRHSGPSREFSGSQDKDFKSGSTQPSDDLPQYVYALAYHVIAFWYIASKMQDRQRHIAFIHRNLIGTDKNNTRVIEEQGRVTMDMMERMAYSDHDETIYDPKFATSADGEINSKTWVHGTSLITIETAGRTGLSQITIRRPSGTRYYVARPQLDTPPRHQQPIITGLTAETYYTSSYVGILPDDVYQAFFAPISICALPSPVLDPPVALPDDDMTRRAIEAFDRVSPLDGHKIGVIYIGEGQTEEAEIFANVMGSVDYTDFITKLGTMIPLKGAQFNTQGLDREYGTDGDFAVCWRDRVSEIVFHATTLMPTNLEHDAKCINKKKHTGNDSVNIIFNDSGRPFRFDTFPSDFNFVYIVITPEAFNTFAESRLQPSPDRAKQRFFKVQVLSKSDFPEISPAFETKIVSGKSLPAFVRLLALNASVFCTVWTQRFMGEHVSSWRTRLREINKLREKHTPAELRGVSTLTPPGTGEATSPLVQREFPGALITRDTSTLFKRASTATFGVEGRSGAEMERTGSGGSGM
ncbi:hypothetical protein M501DRAFT_938801 [Patellaria atrata CBS 101060]|uniref:Rap-GAP domain-containing protein n=1 Tax=Patellaria atrata CBS 101060 TaxID=1346257 RepID=A0A9P4S6M2_9PEZI|nr:hypothetical protein M501DRAFT_938801 [Patellaria atrata CBS 101060]